jgi:hypothetical protein
MARLIVKSPYIKRGGDGLAGGSMKHIATRPGAERLGSLRHFFEVCGVSVFGFNNNAGRCHVCLPSLDFLIKGAYNDRNTKGGICMWNFNHNIDPGIVILFTVTGITLLLSLIFIFPMIIW